MSKPDDIDVDSWNAALEVVYEIGESEQHDTLPIARAIMAAKAGEREACAQIADAYAVQWHEADEGIEQEIVQEISDAIRSRS